MARERKYTVDSNLYIRAFRDRGANAQLQLFHTAFAPFEYLSAIVAHELRAGARDQQARELQRNLFDPFERRGRILAPSYESWKAAGAVLADLVVRKLASWPQISRSFVNDVLLAVSCREHGIVLVTDNLTDFERIAAVYRFDVVPAWPTPSS